MARSARLRNFEVPVKIPDEKLYTLICQADNIWEACNGLLTDKGIIMANKQISQLTTKPTPVASTDQFGIDDLNSDSWKITVAMLQTYFSGIYLALAGGTMAGNIAMGNHGITGLAAPSLSTDACTKGYADSIAAGLEIHASCVCTTTANLTATYNNGSSGVGATLTNSGALAAFSSDGVSPIVGQRVLVKNQSTAAQNGIYVVSVVGDGGTPWVLTRADDYNSVGEGEIRPGDLVTVDFGGTLYGGSSWMQTATVVVVGTDAINFSQFSTAIPVTVPNGGTGLTTTTAYGVLCGGTTATGNFQNAGAGLAGQLFMSNGAAALPSWLATAANGVLVTSAGGVPSIATDIPTAVTIGGQYIYRAGGTDVPVTDGGTGASTATNARSNLGVVWELISTATASSSASVAFTGLSSTYFQYMIAFEDVVAGTDNSAFYIRTSSNNGSSYDSGASDYLYAGEYTNTTPTTTGFGSAGAAQIAPWGGVDNANPVNGTIYILSHSTSANPCSITCFMNGRDGNVGALYGHTLTTGIRNANAIVDAIQILLAAGNIASGTFKLYGLKAATVA